MADKEVLERILSMIPEDFQNFYDAPQRQKRCARRWIRTISLWLHVTMLIKQMR